MSKGLALALLAGGAILVVAAAALGAYLALPPLLERSAARSIQEEFGLESPPQVEFESGPPQEVLAGKFSGGRATITGVEFGGVRAERVVVDLDPLDLKVLPGVLHGEIEAKRPPSGTLRAQLTEGEVSRFVRAGTDVPVRELRLEKDQVLLGSEVTVLGIQTPISVQGGFLLRGASLTFEPRKVSALGVEVPADLANQLLGEADLSYPLVGLPDGATVSSVDVEKNRLVLSGEMRNIPL